MDKLIQELVIIDSLLAGYNDPGYQTEPDNLRCDVADAKERLQKIIIKHQRDTIKIQQENSRVPFGMRSH